MEFKEFTGKTVDDALTNATVSLGVTSSEIKYEVIEEGSNGFLGIGSKDALIKVVISANEDPKDVAKPQMVAPEVKHTANAKNSEDVEKSGSDSSYADDKHPVPENVSP